LLYAEGKKENAQKEKKEKNEQKEK